MIKNKSEKGQALILIVFGIIVLIGMTGLAIDGGNTYSDRRNAQNAADTAALAGGLVASNTDGTLTADQVKTLISPTINTRADSNGYNSTTNPNVTVNVDVQPTTACPNNGTGYDTKVDIVSHVNTYFARVVGFSQFTNTVSATARSCILTNAPLFNGNALVSLSPHGLGFNDWGNGKVHVAGGGIFSNSSDTPSAQCGGSADLTAPSVTTVGGTNLGCSPTITNGVTTGAPQYTWSQYSSLLPPAPACDGTATLAAGSWSPQPGTNGSVVPQSAWGGNMSFNAGVYCVTNSSLGNYHGQITGANGVTFYMTNPNFQMNFNGNGGLTAAAPTSGTYKGVLMYVHPNVDANGNLLCTQNFELHGNGTTDIKGTILAPSAIITLLGNSSTKALDSQIVGCQINGNGTTNANVNYIPTDNYKAQVRPSLSLLK